MALDKIKNIVESKKNISNQKKDSWEWRYFFYDEKFKEKTTNKIKNYSPQPVHKQFTDEYIISPSLIHNIKLRKNNNNTIEKLHIKKIIKTSSNLYKFSSKIIISFPIKNKHIFNLEKLGIPRIRKDVSDIASFRKNLNQSSKEFFLASIKKEITLYDIKNADSGLGKKIRFEISDINIKNKLVYTISIKCKSKKVIAKALKKIEIDDLKGTDYISFIKGPMKVLK